MQWAVPSGWTESRARFGFACETAPETGNRPPAHRLEAKELSMKNWMQAHIGQAGMAEIKPANLYRVAYIFPGYNSVQLSVEDLVKLIN